MIKKLFTRSEFVKNVLTLMTGTTLAQLIPIGISPILTRLYSPDDFSVWALYLSVSSLIIVIATVRYELAIMLPKEDEDAVNILGLSIFVAFFISCISCIVVIIFNQQIAVLLNSPRISYWLYFIPISILMAGVFQAMSYWISRKKKFKKLAYSKVTQTSSTAIVNLGLGFKEFGASGLILGNIAGYIVSNIFLGWQFWKNDHEKLKNISRKRMLQQARIYKDFPKINSLHAFVDILQSSGTVFLISNFFGSAILGLFSYTIKILKAPLAIIGVSVTKVFYQKASEIYMAGGDLKSLVTRTMLYLGIISFPIFLIVLFFAPTIFSFVFGTEWREGGVYAQILSPWLFLNFVVSPISQVPIIVNKQKQVFFISLIGNFLILFSIFYGGFVAGDIKTGFYLLSFFQVIYLSSFIFWIINISKTKKIQND